MKSVKGIATTVLSTAAIFLMTGTSAFAAEEIPYTEYAPLESTTAIETISDLFVDEEDAYKEIVFTVTPMEATTMYITNTVNLRSIPDKSGKYLGTLYNGNEVTVVGVVESNSYNRIVYYVTDKNEYVHGNYISANKPAGKQLPVANIMQNPDLPNGCEITSLTICLNYKGYSVDKCDMSDNYLPKWADLTGDPEYYYLREPRSNGFYCFASCICTTIDNYNNANGTSIPYANLTGSDVSTLYQELENGNPVVVWGTLRWGTPRQYSSGLYSNLHCMVLSGYTDTTVTITDPIYGVTTVKRSTFETVWRQMGSRAVVVY